MYIRVHILYRICISNINRINLPNTGEPFSFLYVFSILLFPERETHTVIPYINFHFEIQHIGNKFRRSNNETSANINVMYRQIVNP